MKEERRCELCGRSGTRGFTEVFQTDDRTWLLKCTAEVACGERQRRKNSCWGIRCWYHRQGYNACNGNGCVLRGNSVARAYTPEGTPEPLWYPDATDPAQPAVAAEAWIRREMAREQCAGQQQPSLPLWKRLALRFALRCVLWSRLGGDRWTSLR